MEEFKALKKSWKILKGLLILQRLSVLDVARKSWNGLRCDKE